jgi:hypothetical protein
MAINIEDELWEARWRLRRWLAICRGQRHLGKHTMRIGTKIPEQPILSNTTFGAGASRGLRVNVSPLVFILETWQIPITLENIHDPPSGHGFALLIFRICFDECDLITRICVYSESLVRDALNGGYNVGR